MPRKLADDVASTRALAPARDAARRRASRAKRELLAPREPAAALDVYISNMETYHERVARLVEREVIKGGRAPHELAEELDRLARAMSPSMRAAGRRVSVFGKSEARRLLRRRIPKDLSDTFMIDEFVKRNIEFVRGVGRRQLEALAAVPLDSVERERLLRHALWVSRVQSANVARDQVRRFSRETTNRWVIASGGREGVYTSHRDERTRTHHRALDGKIVRYDALPETLSEVNCRCSVIPLEALDEKR